MKREGNTMSKEQEGAARSICQRYNVAFDANNFHTQFDLPAGYVAGWIGTAIYVGISPTGQVSS